MVARRVRCEIAPARNGGVWIKHRQWWWPRVSWYCRTCQQMHAQTVSQMHALDLTVQGAHRWHGGLS